MSENNLKRPTQKAVRSQQTLTIWLLLWVVIGLGLQYSSYILYRDMGGLNPGSIMLSLTGLIILAILPMRYYKELMISRELENNGVTTPGKITETWVKRRGGRSKSTSYYVAYQFGDGHGAVQRVGYFDYKRINVDDTVMVRHLPGDPSHSRFEVERL